MSHGFRSYVNRVGYSTVSLPPAPQCAASVSSGSSSSSSESWQLSTVNGLVLLAFITHRIHGAAIYGNIYHQYTPNVSIYTSTMDPMGNEVLFRSFQYLNSFSCNHGAQMSYLFVSLFVSCGSRDHHG